MARGIPDITQAAVRMESVERRHELADSRLNIRKQPCMCTRWQFSARFFARYDGGHEVSLTNSTAQGSAMVQEQLQNETGRYHEKQ